MKKEEKQLLLKDLCGRLPYGVIVSYKSPFGESDIKVTCYNIGYVLQPGNGWWSECKPYLHPMSSMTDEERTKIASMAGHFNDITKAIEVCFACLPVVDYCYSRHLDIHGLIEKGLALEAPDSMYKNLSL